MIDKRFMRSPTNEDAEGMSRLEFAKWYNEHTDFITYKHMLSGESVNSASNFAIWLNEKRNILIERMKNCVNCEFADECDHRDPDHIACEDWVLKGWREVTGK